MLEQKIKLNIFKIGIILQYTGNCRLQYTLSWRSYIVYYELKMNTRWFMIFVFKYDNARVFILMHNINIILYITLTLYTLEHASGCLSMPVTAWAYPWVLEHGRDCSSMSVTAKCEYIYENRIKWHHKNSVIPNEIF